MEHAHYIPWAWKLAIVAYVYVLKVLLSPFRRVEVLGAFQLSRAAYFCYGDLDGVCSFVCSLLRSSVQW
jgi:hypothetical protein